jgi:hypothetical protein
MSVRSEELTSCKAKPSHRRRTINSRDRRNRWFLRGAREPKLLYLAKAQRRPSEGLQKCLRDEVAWDTLNRTDRRRAGFAAMQQGGHEAEDRQISLIHHQASNIGSGTTGQHTGPQTHSVTRWRKDRRGRLRDAADTVRVHRGAVRCGAGCTARYGVQGVE